ncbi:hypothetical protein C8Z91_19075 [Paenibacillus elgii]|uniref:Uncharacterized protein n=1 Tax=Paenibacillus elgii TaxID=189691 RepID=A0A2T6FZX3_9BACL|nr:hypothetical protein [Paenibacillus elgii]PUA37454.1 hypothetical protein C8Z91_19075 [Paenibacillus elgii]
MGLLYELIRHRNLSRAGSIADRSIPVRLQTKPEERRYGSYIQRISGQVFQEEEAQESIERAPERNNRNGKGERHGAGKE